MRGTWPPATRKACPGGHEIKADEDRGRSRGPGMARQALIFT